MKQIIRRRVVIGQHGNVLIGQRPVVIGHANVLNRIGEEPFIESRGPLDDFFDIHALLVLGGDDDDVLYRFDADVVGTARGKNVDLRENAAAGF